MADWRHMPRRARLLVGGIGTFSGWVAYVVMSALAPVTGSGHLDAGPPVATITVTVLVSLVGQHVAWWWRRDRATKRRLKGAL